MHELVKEWKQFIETGHLPEPINIRSVVASAWNRCRTRAIDPLVLPKRLKLSPFELSERTKAKHELYEVARPFVEKLLRIITGTDFVIALADEDGYILDVFGDQAVLKEVHSLDVVPGSNWKEEIKGNNSIGTVLISGQPLQFIGAEHYLFPFHSWSCSGAPIYDPAGNLTGVFNISAPKILAHPHTLGMVVAASQAIEHELKINKQKKELVAVNQYILGNTPHAIVTIDCNGIITSFSKKAENLFGINALEVIGHPLANLKLENCLTNESEKFERIMYSTLDTGRQYKNLERIYNLNDSIKKHCNVSTYPLQDDNNESIGVMAVIRETKERRKYEKNYLEWNKESSSLSVLDNLTRLYNHKFFHEKLAEDITKAGLQNGKLALLMLDIDYFKHYNDMLGYPTGDKLLCEFSYILRQNIRGKDIIARYGGEEFTIILRDADSKLAMDIAERIRSAIETYPFEGREVQPKGKLTVSIGVSCYPGNATSKEELVKFAEEALLKSKHTSKNKVALYFSVFDDLKSELNQSDLNLLNTIKTLITVINAKDKYTFGHSERVVKYSAELAKYLGMSDQQIKYIKYGAYLHDIGKIEISRDTLNKIGPLTCDEWDVLRCHPQWGTEIVKPVSALKQILPQILHHHERYDGKGYPYNLKSIDIPLNARLLTITDSFDAMTTNRPYQKAKSIDEAVRELKQCAGLQFDPEMVDAFTMAIKNISFDAEEKVS